MSRIGARSGSRPARLVSVVVRVCRVAFSGVSLGAHLRPKRSVESTHASAHNCCLRTLTRSHARHSTWCLKKSVSCTLELILSRFACRRLHALNAWASPLATCALPKGVCYSLTYLLRRLHAYDLDPRMGRETCPMKIAAAAAAGWIVNHKFEGHAARVEKDWLDVYRFNTNCPKRRRIPRRHND